jgi:isochorismate pyruvate lyase
MNLPDECADLRDVRAEIDRIDREVIALLGQRFAYVKAAAKFKTSREGVKAPDRLEAMLRQRREWAVPVGLDPDVIEKLYRDLVSYFIEEEMKHWRKQTTTDEEER